MKKLEDFDEFLVSPDEDAKNLGWLMAFKGLLINKMSLDELCYTLLQIHDNKYNRYSNKHRTNLRSKIIKNIKEYSQSRVTNAQHRAAEKFYKN